MSHLTRSFLLAVIVSAGIASDSPSTAQPIESKLQIPARISVDGKFSRYLEAPNGDIDGLVLEDGTVGRFAPFKRGAQAALFRPGDAVRVEGDPVSGLTRGYLVRALVTRNSVPTTRGAIAPRLSTGVAATDPRPRGAGRSGKGTLKAGPLQPRTSGKPRGPSADRSKRVDDVLLVNSTSLRARKKNRLETIESKTSEATTGKDRSSDYSQWSRSQETAGP
jgi:hypothetical protein